MPHNAQTMQQPRQQTKPTQPKSLHQYQHMYMKLASDTAADSCQVFTSKSLYLLAIAQLLTVRQGKLTQKPAYLIKSWEKDGFVIEIAILIPPFLHRQV